MGQHHGSGLAARPARADDQRIAVLDAPSALERCARPVGTEHRGGLEGLELGVAGRGRQSDVQGGGRVALLPHRA